MRPNMIKRGQNIGVNQTEVPYHLQLCKGHPSPSVFNRLVQSFKLQVKSLYMRSLIYMGLPNNDIMA